MGPKLFSSSAVHQPVDHQLTTVEGDKGSKQVKNFGEVSEIYVKAPKRLKALGPFVSRAVGGYYYDRDQEQD